MALSNGYSSLTPDWAKDPRANWLVRYRGMDNCCVVLCMKSDPRQGDMLRCMACGKIAYFDEGAWHR